MKLVSVVDGDRRVLEVWGASQPRARDIARRVLGKFYYYDELPRSENDEDEDRSLFEVLSLIPVGLRGV